MSWARHQVLGLYRRLLRLHQHLPGDFSALGSKFVREEFKSHMNVSKEHATLFIREWNNFAVSLENQVQFLSHEDKVSTSNEDSLSGSSFGNTISKNELDLFNEQQLLQLFELYEEVRKPADSNRNG